MLVVRVSGVARESIPLESLPRMLGAPSDGKTHKGFLACVEANVAAEGKEVQDHVHDANGLRHKEAEQVPVAEKISDLVQLTA
eukprot:scaffold1220_cov259-Pinguiococcus_pyrenoidosus.AAC.154